MSVILKKKGSKCSLVESGGLKRKSTAVSEETAGETDTGCRRQGKRRKPSWKDMRLQ
mgnify:CR=1 FL=1